MKRTPIASDPECSKSSGVIGGVGVYGPTEDGLNVRYTNDMKRHYGYDPQFPIERYVDGLRSLAVPNREGGHARRGRSALRARSDSHVGVPKWYM